jgi:hypothetical protein
MADMAGIVQYDLHLLAFIGSY